MFLKLFIVTGTFHPSTGVGDIGKRNNTSLKFWWSDQVTNINLLANLSNMRCIF